MSNVDRRAMASLLRDFAATLEQQEGPVLIHEVLDLAEAIGAVVRVDRRSILWLETRWTAPLPAGDTNDEG